MLQAGRLAGVLEVDESTRVFWIGGDDRSENSQKGDEEDGSKPDDGYWIP
jgi:hypothetical protein